MKDTLVADEKVKKTMQNKIIDLKTRIDNYKEEILKRGGKVEDFEDDEKIINPNNQLDDINDNKVEKERRGFEYMIASTALANGKLYN
jgi:hypothetical protein